jgi:hypothetical protein
VERSAEKVLYFYALNFLYLKDGTF